VAKKAPKAEVSNAFAVIATGGKQYKVAVGDNVKIEKILGGFVEGDTITFDKVLLVDDGTKTTIGEPEVSGAEVKGTLKKIGRAQKVIVMKYKQKSRYYKKNGHRQPYFEVTIDSIK
jgi:large subunit ribosomal protein L21